MPKNVTSGKNAGGQPSSEPASTLSRLIRERGISYTALANSIGTTRQTVSNYASGAVFPPSDMLATLSDYFGVTTDYLLGRTTCSTDAPDKRAACDYTGLSEEAVEFLHEAQKNPSAANLTPVSIISFLLRNNSYRSLLQNLTRMYTAIKFSKDYFAGCLNVEEVEPLLPYTSPEGIDYSQVCQHLISDLRSSAFDVLLSSRYFDSLVTTALKYKDAMSLEYDRLTDVPDPPPELDFSLTDHELEQSYKEFEKVVKEQLQFVDSESNNESFPD